MAEDEDKWIPPVARDWEDAATNEQYWWNRRECKAVEGCGKIRLSFRDKCWDHLEGKERENYSKEILAKYEEGESLQGLNLRKVYLLGETLERARLEGANLEGARLEWAYLIEARLEGAILYKAWLERAKLKEARLERAYLIEARLEGAILEEARLERAYLIEARLERADLSFARLEGADLRDARLEGTNLTGANLMGADLSNARVGSPGYTQSKAPIEKRKVDDGDEERLILKETDIKPKGETTDFSKVKYNPHTRVFLFPFTIVGWGFKKFLRKLRRKEPPLKPRYGNYKQTKFIGIDTTKLDHSKNPTLARDIRYQQFLADFRERRPRWFYRLAYLLWGVTSFFGESLSVWLLWASVIVVAFALIFCGYIPNLEVKISLIDGPPISGFTDALYLSGLVFTSLGLGHFTPQDTLAKMLVLAEVMVGFIMLGSLVSFFANKFVRRD